MKILIPASEGKSKIIASSNLKFEDTKFMFEDSVRQVVNLLELIDEEDLRSIYGTSQEKSILFHRQNQSIFKEKCVPAITRYTGVVYENIGWNDLSIGKTVTGIIQKIINNNNQIKFKVKISENIVGIVD